MFKSIFSYGLSKGHSDHGNSDKESISSNGQTNMIGIPDDIVQQTEKLTVSQHCSRQQSSNSSNNRIGKKSRKKLSAMMGKIQSSMGGQQAVKSSSGSNGSQDNCSELNNNDYLEEDKYSEGQEKSESKRNKNKGNNNKLADIKQEESIDYDDDKANYLLPEEQCDIPTFLQTKNCDSLLIEETRRLLTERFNKNPDSFYPDDYQRMLTDDWTVSRFLLRRRLDPKRTAKLMEECGRFRKQYKMSEMKLWEFPIEFHKAGGLFKYAPDRVGNLTVYMRVKMYRRVPEISDVFKAFILCVLEESDMANHGRGTAVIFDLSGCGLQNVDLSFLSWLLSSFRNYCPKGVSYILVYNLPWILNATCKLAMTWMSASNRRALRFVYGDEIENFIAKENLPDYLNGSCPINYREVPEGSLPATVCCERLDMTPEQALKIRELFKEYLDEDDYIVKDEGKQKKGKSKVNKQQQIANGTTGVDARPNKNSDSSLGTTQSGLDVNPSSVEIVSQASKFIA